VERWEALRKKDAVSQQELDERRSADAQARANLAAADANVERLRQTESFKRVVAPFAGVITRRNVDVGDLIDAGGAGRALFLLSQTDPLRVYVSVPQAYSQLVKPGQEVIVTQAELAGRNFHGKVARTSASIDAATRTMQVEVSLPNPDGALLPGAYVQVALPMQSSRALVIPTNALIMRADGMRVAVLDTAGRVNLRPVKIGRNFGNTVELLEGAAATDRLVLNPPDSLAEGDKVAIAPAAKDAK
jgi:RND family efflux transporter MFP subunit